MGQFRWRGQDRRVVWGIVLLLLLGLAAEGQVLQSNIPLLLRDKTGLIPGQQRTH
jgi:hypothetical protein